MKGRRPALVALLALMSVGFAVVDGVERGNRLFMEGRYAEAVAAYREALAQGEEAPELQYNLGTALLRLGQLEEAERHLRMALESVDPDVRQPAYYNLGNRYLDAARGPGGEAGAKARLLEGAVDSYQRALRLDPSDADAKWNLELALQQQEQLPPTPSAGGDQEQDERQEGEPDEPGESQPGDPRGGEGERAASGPGELTPAQAERILNAVEQDERALYREKLRKGRRDRPVLRNW